MEKLLLGGIFSLEKLNIVDQEDVDGTVLVFEDVGSSRS